MPSLNAVIRAITLSACLLFVASCSEPAKDQSSDQQQGQQPAQEKKTGPKATDGSTLELSDKAKEGQTAKLDNAGKAADGSCKTLSQGDCLLSKKCVVDQGGDKGYFCRATVDKCEVGFVQGADDPKVGCVGELGCKYVAASCFCPEGKQCICGGGKPPMCQTSGKSSAM